MHRPILFLAGPHASGKTELTTHLVIEKGYSSVDLGPSIRAAHKNTSPEISFSEWIRQGEDLHGVHFTDEIAASAVKDSMLQNTDNVPLIISGSRSYPGLNYLVDVFKMRNFRTMYVDASNELMFERYKNRENKPDLSIGEFEDILAKDQAMGIETIRYHADWVAYNCGTLATFFSNVTDQIKPWIEY